MNNRIASLSSLIRIAPAFAALALIMSCSSGPQPKTDTLAYAKLNNERFFENSDLPTVWKAVQEVFKNFKIKSENDDKHQIETDWFVTEAHDRYQTIVIDKLQHSRPLESRLKFKAVAESLFGGSKVTVTTSEEIETVNNDGTHSGFSGASSPDPARAATILDNIGRVLLSSKPTI